MTTTPQPATETVRVHETPYVLRVEIDLPDGAVVVPPFALPTASVSVAPRIQVPRQR